MTKSKLQSLFSANQEVKKTKLSIPTQDNGIACPACHNVLRDTGEVVPLQARIVCTGCTFSGHRLLDKTTPTD